MLPDTDMISMLGTFKGYSCNLPPIEHTCVDLGNDFPECAVLIEDVSTFARATPDAAL
jgi:hypothetical protein